MHDASKLMLASIRSNVKDVSSFDVDPASFPAGLRVCLASTGLPSLASSAGMPIGVSLGRSLSDHKKTDVGRTGLRVPMQAHLKRATALITISSYANLVSGTDDVLSIAGVDFTAQAGAATPGDATFQAATGNSQTATSLAAQINAHAVAKLVVYAVASSATVRVYSIVDGEGDTGTGNDIDLTYTDNDSNIGIVLSETSMDKLAAGSDDIDDIDYMVVGAKAYINKATGKLDVAMTGFSLISDGVYIDPDGLGTPVRTGIDEDNIEVAAAMIDMQGGL